MGYIFRAGLKVKKVQKFERSRVHPDGGDTNKVKYNWCPVNFLSTDETVLVLLNSDTDEIWMTRICSLT